MTEPNSSLFNLCQTSLNHNLVSGTSLSDPTSGRLLKSFLRHDGSFSSDFNPDHSLKLKSLLEKRVTEPQHDPYAFIDMEHQDGAVPPFKAAGFERLQEKTLHPTINGRNILNGGNLTASVHNDQYAYVEAMQSGKVKKEMEFRLDDTVRYLPENMCQKEKFFKFGKSQMSRLAMTKIERNNENQNQNLERVVPPKKTENTLNFLARHVVSSEKNVSNSYSANGHAPSLKIYSSGLSPKSIAMAGQPADSVSTPVVTSSITNKKRASLQFMWNLRNKIKLVKRSYEEHIGSIIGEKDSNCSDTGVETILIQKYWFPLCHDYNSFTGSNHKRETKLMQLKSELRQKLMQCQWRHRDRYQKEMGQVLIDCARSRPNLAAFLTTISDASFAFKSRPSLQSEASEIKCKYKRLDDVDACCKPVLPGTPYCPLHITHHTSQLLFSPCSACGEPALGRHRSFCHKHQQKCGPYPPMASETKSSKSLHSRRHRSTNASYRSRKRKRQHGKEKEYSSKNIGYVAPSDPVSSCFTLINENIEGQEVHVEVGEEVGNASGDLIDPGVLPTLDNHSLEESDLSHVLNHISPEAFNDLFTDKYETESEELERALEAVNNETLTLLNMLDPETLANLPEIMQLPGPIGPSEQSICENTLFIPPHADVLKS